jgi:hypothetical protein
MPSSKGTRRNIVRDIEGDRYLLTARRLLQLDSEDAKEGTPWYAFNKDIRTLAQNLSADYLTNYIPVHSRTSKIDPTIVQVEVGFGKYKDRYQLGCATFDLAAFTRILRNAGVKTTKKAFAAQAGA